MVLGQTEALCKVMLEGGFPCLVLRCMEGAGTVCAWPVLSCWLVFRIGLGLVETQNSVPPLCTAGTLYPWQQSSACGSSLSVGF